MLAAMLVPSESFRRKKMATFIKKRAMLLIKDQSEVLGIIKKGQLITSYCRPNAVPLRLCRNHNYYYHQEISS